MVTASDLFRSLLIATLEVSRPTLVSDGAGGSTEQEQVVAEVSARLRPLKPAERESAARLEVAFDHIAYVEAPADIQRGDYLQDSDRSSVRYRVVEVVEPSYAGHHLQVHCRREVD